MRRVFILAAFLAGPSEADDLREACAALIEVAQISAATTKATTETLISQGIIDYANGVETRPVVGAAIELATENMRKINRILSDALTHCPGG